MGRTDIAGPALIAIKLDRDRKHTENERIPQEEERVKLPDRRLSDHTHPREDERKCA